MPAECLCYVLLSIVFHIAPSVRSCEELASGRPGRRNRLPHLPCCARVCKLGGAGGFACRANFSHLHSAGPAICLTDQKISFNPSCNCRELPRSPRAVRVAVIWPNVDAVSEFCGCVKLGWLSRLNASARNCSD